MYIMGHSYACAWLSTFRGVNPQPISAQMQGWCMLLTASDRCPCHMAHCFRSTGPGQVGEIGTNAEPHGSAEVEP